MSEVRGRIGAGWEAAPSELARTIDVSVASTEARSIARIDFVDGGGQSVSRTVSAATCSEVVSGIALITVLAIESRVAEAVDRSEPLPAAPTTPEAAGPLATTPAPPSAGPAEAAKLPPKIPATARPASTPSPSPLHWDVGGAAVAGNGVGPAFAWGARLFGGVGWGRGPDFRLGVDYLKAPISDAHSVSTLFYLLAGRISACPLALRLLAGARLLPCAGALSGVLRGQTFPSKLVQEGAGARAFVTPLVEVRADATFRALFVELGVEARFPLEYRKFSVSPLYEYEVPPVELGVSAGIGLRL